MEDTLKIIYKVPELEQNTNKYFNILGKSLSYAGEFENNCIELAKFSLVEKQIKKLPYPSTKFDYEDMLRVIQLKRNKDLFTNENTKYEKVLNDFIKYFCIKFKMDKKTSSIFYEAKNIRNKIAHKYPKLFFTYSDNFTKLKEICSDLKNDIQSLIHGNLIIYLFYSLLFQTNNINEIKFTTNKGIILDKYEEQITNWIFNDRL